MKDEIKKQDITSNEASNVSGGGLVGDLVTKVKSYICKDKTPTRHIIAYGGPAIKPTIDYGGPSIRPKVLDKAPRLDAENFIQDNSENSKKDFE